MNKNEAMAPQEEDLHGVPSQEDASESFGPKGCVSKESVEHVLDGRGLQLQGGRDLLSAGAYGQLFLLHARGEGGEEIKIVETTFSRLTQGPGKRYLIRDVEPKAGSLLAQAREKTLPRERLSILGKETGKAEKIIVDLLYNEDRALRELAGIPGIPKSYGGVYEGVMGSSLKEFVDGYDLWFMAEHVQSEEEANAVFDKIKDTYTQAAKKGFVLGSPTGATIMVDSKTQQPYITDWRYHSTGNVEVEGPVREVYEKGLADIESTRGFTIEALRERLEKERAAA